MASAPVSFLLQHVRQLAADDAAADAELVRMFLARRDEAAFATLVRRHGRMVLRVCRAVLRCLADAEDAFQATFLLLARQLSSIRNPAAVGSWLHGTAQRVALNARAAAARRRRHEHAAEPPASVAPDDVARDELAQVLHAELARLPERFRVPIWLCYLEGLTLDDAAGRLGWPATTVKGRLQRGRELLRRRLTGRGLGLSALAAALAAGGEAEAAPLAAALVQATVAAVMGNAPPRIAALAGGALGWTLAAKLQAMLGVLLAASVLAAGVAALLAPIRPAQDTPPTAPAQPGPLEARAPLPAAKEKPAKADDDPLPRGALARLGTRRLRHAGQVGTVDFSPDGKLLLSAASDGMIRLWNAATGKQIRQIEENYYATAFSPDSEWLAAVDHNGNITLHEVFIGKNTRRIGAHPETVVALAFAPNGKWLATGGQTGTVVIWDLAAARQKHLLKLPTSGCFSVSFSPDGRLLAAAGDKGAGRVWDTVTGEERYPLTASTVAFAPNGKLLAAADVHGVVFLLDPATGNELGRLEGGWSEWRSSVAFSADSKLLAWGSDDALRVFDVASRHELHHLPVSPGGVAHVAFSEDGKALAWATGYAIRVREMATWKERFPPDGHITNINAVVYSPDGRTIATGGTYDNRILLWDVATGKQRRAIDCEGRGAHCLAFAPDGRSLAAGLTWYHDRDSRGIGIWDVASGKRVQQLGQPSGAVLVAYSADGNSLAAYDSGISIWDVKGGKQRATIQPGGHMVHSLAFTPQGRSLLATTYGLPLCEWDTATGKELRRFEGKPQPYQRLSVFPGCRYVAVGCRSSTDPPEKYPIRIWEVASGHQVAAVCPDDEMPDDIAISSDGRLIACLRHDATIRIHDALTGDELRRFHDKSVPMLIAFGPDGKTLASAGWDTTATLWDVTDLAKKLPRPEALSRDRAATLVSDLDSSDAVKAYAAVRALARAGDQGVPLLRERLARSVPVRDPIAKLIADLDDDSFAVRERASAELEKIGAAAIPALLRALEAKPSPEVKRRIEALLVNPAPSTVAPERLAALRAVEALELIGTPEARAALEAAAKGTPGAPATEAALEALDCRRKGDRNP
jgi:RNA polymerase sigma factor (sigma-70 family)